ncbi:MAG TPA: phage major capsid protein, partial [Actinoplanes sp.]|nr:phage major capsid protein [Actinoplanes sp.]
MTVEEILAALQAIIDEAGAEPLSEEQATAYEKLEVQLKAAQKSEEIRKRNAAYNTVRVPAGVPSPGSKPEDSIELAFTAYLRTGRPNADISGLRVSNAQSTGSDPAGGYMVPPGFRQKLVDVQKAFGGIGPEADGFSTDNGSTLEYPSVDDTANSGQITAEGAAVAGGADLVFGTVALGAFKYTSSGASNAPLKVSVELLQDAAFDVQGLISRKLGMRIARKQAVDWVTGTGTTLPFGIARAALTANVTLAAGNA